MLYKFALAVFATLTFTVQASVVVISKESRVPFNSTGALEICWVKPLSQDTQALVVEIERYVHAQISERAGLKIEFKPDCFLEKDPFFPIGIAFYDDPLTTEGIRMEVLGQTLDRNHPGHPYNFSGGIWSLKNLIDINLSSRFGFVNPDLVAQAKDLSAEGALNLKKTIAVHEILHSLGYAHEQSHRDSTCEVGPEKFKAHVHKLLTDYDPGSIMNYCRTRHFNYETGPIPLSEKDIEGLKFYLN